MAGDLRREPADPTAHRHDGSGRVRTTIGVEWVRRLLRLGAAIGVAIDTVLVTLLVGHGADAGAVATGVALLGGSLFTLWALGHRSVQAWVFDRWLVRHRL